MKAELSPAVDALRAQLQEQLAEVIETKKMINSLLKRMGDEPEFSDVYAEQNRSTPGDNRSSSGRPDLYYGKPFATAAQMVLELRKQACSADEIMTALENGGFDFKALGWKDDDRLRMVAISLGKNPKFHKLPNKTYGLSTWYPGVTGRNGDGE